MPIRWFKTNHEVYTQICTIKQNAAAVPVHSLANDS